MSVKLSVVTVFIRVYVPSLLVERYTAYFVAPVTAFQLIFGLPAESAILISGAAGVFIFPILFVNTKPFLPFIVTYDQPVLFVK